MSSKPIWRPHLAILLAATLTVALSEKAQGQALNLANLVIVATPSTGVAPLTTTFSLGQTMPISYVEALYWNFGDGNESESEFPTHVYSSPGTYVVSADYLFYSEQVVSVMAYGLNPQFSTVTRTVVVNPTLDTSFTASPRTGTAPLTVNFTDTSVGQPTSWSWNFGDGTTSTVRHPTHTYAAPGNYDVTLVASTSGASDSHTQFGYVSAGVPNLTISNITVCGTGSSCGGAVACVLPTGLSADICINGSGFTAASVVYTNGSPRPTTFVNPTQLGVRISLSASSPNFLRAGDYTVTVRQAGSTSNGVPLTVRNPVPTLSGISPAQLNQGVIAGSGSTTITIGGGIFASDAKILVDGVQIASTTLDLFTIQGVLPPSLIAIPRPALTIRVQNPAPGGGLSSNSLPLNVVGPQITGVSGPAIPIPLAPSTSASLFVFGSNFLPGAVVYLDGVPKSTLVVDESQVRFTLSSTLPQLQQRGAIVLNVVNPGMTIGAASNSFAVRVGSGGSNKGTIGRVPIAPSPGDFCGIGLTSGTSAQPYTMIVDTLNPSPFYPFATPIADQVLGVRPIPGVPGSWLALVDGLGLFGPSTGTAFDAAGTDLAFSFTLPNPPIGVAVTLQGVYLDPGAPEGYYLTWARRESL